MPSWSTFCEIECMRKIGFRNKPPLIYAASSALLVEGACFSESMAKLALCSLTPKGV
jgi:hypothetical protein